MGLTINPVDLMSQPLFKPTKLVPSRSKETWLGKHVKWLKEERIGLQKIAVCALIALEVLTLAFSVIGLVPLAWGIQEWRGLERKEQFFKRAEQASRPSNAQIHLKTDRRTFNHVHDFAIEDGIIWCRQHNHVHEEWKPVYFDGWAYGESPQRISSDGANLIAVDQNNYVHYKKVLTEFRNSEISEANRHKLAHGEVDLDQDAYIAVDKSKRDNWYDKWCSLPYMNAHFFVNLLTGKRLKLPEFIKAFSISHRGLYNHYLSDAQGRTHLTDGGTTTLYGLDQNGRVIHLYDPWSPQLAKITIPLPESSERLFEADGIQSSASTLMVYGYEQERGKDARTLQILTQMVDIDTAGWNPFFEYAYFSQPEKPSQWAVPFPSWQAHPLELEENSCVTKTMTIIQTGEGNEARELRVEGVKQGQAGIYFKKIDEPHWRFIGTEQAADLVMQQALPLSKPIEKPFNCSMRNYRSQQLQFSHLSAHAAARLQHFSPHALQGQLELTIDGQTYPLELFKVKLLKNFFGISSNTYQLVIPERLRGQQALKTCFQGQAVISVEIVEKEGTVRIKSNSSPYFEFDFAAED